MRYVLGDGIGSVALIETYGSDQRIVEAARMSTGKGFLGWRGCPEHPVGAGEVWPADEPVCPSCGCDVSPGDERLLRYLWTHRHTTPFEMAGAIFEIKAPLFVFREWHRHRTQSYNEFSARYAQMPDQHYVPSLERLRAVTTANKQAQSVAGPAPDRALGGWRLELQRLQSLVYAHYEEGLTLGVPKEIARVNTPVARYSTMRVASNLLNWTRFLGLRNHPAAQWEIQQYAIEVARVLRQQFPRTMALVDERPLSG